MGEREIKGIEIGEREQKTENSLSYLKEKCHFQELFSKYFSQKYIYEINNYG